MLCQCCHERPALEKEGRVVQVALFETIEGCFCEVCLLALQGPFDAAMRRAIAERAPHLSEEDLARLPAQMLKFTLMLPLPRGGSHSTTSATVRSKEGRAVRTQSAP